MKKIMIAILVFALIAIAGCVQKPFLGESCGTVSPDSRDKCCAMKMDGKPHIMCVGGWKYNLDTSECEFICAFKEITSFAECEAAGYPIMESYPEQCSANGKVFVAERPPVEPPVQENEVLIGGQRDEHGCLGPAGYGWDEEIEACIRIWELDESQRKAAKIAVESTGPEKGLTVTEVQVQRCPGCFNVEFDTYGERTNVPLINWKAGE